MAKLILSMDNLVLKEIPLDQGAHHHRPQGAQRHPDRQSGDFRRSTRSIVTILNDSFLEDLDSTNGTFVNGKPVKKHFLQNNDVIELGKYRLKYIKEQSAAAAQEDFEKTMVLRPEMMRKAAEPSLAGAGAPSMLPPMNLAPPAETPAAMPTIPPPPSPMTQATPAAPAAPAPTTPAQAQADVLLGAIQVLTGSNAGKTLDLVKSITTLGKPGVQVAVIARRPHGYFLTHVEGPRFPQVNGSPIDIQAHALKDHDIIELAGVKMEFFLRD